MSGATLVADRPRTDFWSTSADELQLPEPLGQPAPGTSDERSWGGTPEAARAILQRARFNRLADQLETASVGVSATRRLSRNPDFVEILLMGDDAIPMLIERVQTSESRPTWLKLLSLLTSLPPSAGEETIDASAEAWLRWARTKLPRS